MGLYGLRKHQKDQTIYDRKAKHEISLVDSRLVEFPASLGVRLPPLSRDSGVLPCKLTQETYAFWKKLVASKDPESRIRSVEFPVWLQTLEFLPPSLAEGLLFKGEVPVRKHENRESEGTRHGYQSDYIKFSNSLNFKPNSSTKLLKPYMHDPSFSQIFFEADFYMRYL